MKTRWPSNCGLSNKTDPHSVYAILADVTELKLKTATDIMMESSPCCRHSHIIRVFRALCVLIESSASAYNGILTMQSNEPLTTSHQLFRRSDWQPKWPTDICFVLATMAVILVTCWWVVTGVMCGRSAISVSPSQAGANNSVTRSSYLTTWCVHHSHMNRGSAW